MADEKKTKAPSLKTEKLPVAPPTENNTSKTTVESDDIVERSEDAVSMVVAKTGSVPADAEALVAEMSDQIATERKAAEKQVVLEGSQLDALALERRDHAETLAKALGQSALVEATYEERKAVAVARNKVLAGKSRDTSKDSIHESKPSNWIMTTTDGENIEAYNVITGREFKGDRKELSKVFHNTKED